MKKIIFVIFIIFCFNLYPKVGFKESTIIENEGMSRSYNPFPA